MNAAQEQALTEEVEKAVEETVRTFPARNHTATLATQWDTLGRYEQELRDRVRRERLAIVAEYERLVTETNADFERRLDDAMSDLSKQRLTALRTLRNTMEDKMREHDLLSQRMQSI